MARVILLEPPSPAGENLSRGLMGGFGMRVGRQLSYPPIPLAQIASVLETRGHEVAILDADAARLNPEQTVQQVVELRACESSSALLRAPSHRPSRALRPLEIARYSCVAVPCEGRPNDALATGSMASQALRPRQAPASSTLQIVAYACSKDGFEAELSLCRRLREAAQHDLHVCLFGPMAQHHKKECLEAGARWVVVGEPEAVLPELLADVGSGRPVEVAGAYCWHDGQVVGQGSGRIENLDHLPIPAYHLLDFRSYGYPDDPRPMTVVHASRGCPIGCPFCAYMVTEGRQVRSRSVEHIMEEIEAARAHGIEIVVFRDPIFTLERGRILDLCAALEARRRDPDWSTEWICETALSCLDPELLGAMARAGCIALSFGVESGNAELQKKYAKNKIRSHDHAVAMVEQCRALGIRTRGFFMMGFPEETEAMRDETVALALRLDPDTVQFVPLTLYEGTPLYDELKVGIEASRCPDVAPSIRRAYRRFYTRPGRLLRELKAPRSLLRKAGRYARLDVAGSSLV